LSVDELLCDNPLRWVSFVPISKTTGVATETLRWTLGVNFAPQRAQALNNVRRFDLSSYAPKNASAGSAILLFMFATSMVISGLSQFDWAVYVLAAGAFILATVDATLLSIDSIVLTKEESWNSPVATRPTPQ